MENRSIPLTEIEEGATAVIAAITAPPPLRQRLYELGFCPDTVIRLTLKTADRLVCDIEQTRMGLHSSIASTIHVLPLEKRL